MCLVFIWVVSFLWHYYKHIHSFLHSVNLLCTLSVASYFIWQDYDFYGSSLPHISSLFLSKYCQWQSKKHYWRWDRVRDNWWRQMRVSLHLPGPDIFRLHGGWFGQWRSLVRGPGPGWFQEDGSPGEVGRLFSRLSRIWSLRWYLHT